jgi:hypothetical protein
MESGGGSEGDAQWNLRKETNRRGILSRENWSIITRNIEMGIKRSGI